MLGDPGADRHRDRLCRFIAQRVLRQRDTAIGTACHPEVFAPPAATGEFVIPQ